MRTVNIFKAKSDLSRLVHAVESGAEPEIVIARNGKPAARLVPLATKTKKAVKRIGVAKIDVDIPPTSPELDAEIARLFYGEDRAAKPSRKS